ncbi:MAG: FG-GAP-like repeat-containing protein [Vicinamibacteria bacterium]
MKRSLVVLAIAFITLFAAITILKQYTGPGAASDDVEESERRTAIRTFWDHYNDATSARSRNEFAEAAVAYRAALEINPGHEESLFYLAACLQEMGEYPQAVDTLRRLTDIDPTSNRGFAQLGVLLSTPAPGVQPDFAEASAALERSKRINYEQTGPFIRKGVLELNRGELKKAREVLQAPAQAGAPEALYLAGLTEYLQEDFDAASKLFLRVLDSHARETAVGKRGVTSEGDVRTRQTRQEQRALTPLESAAIKSRFLLYWTALRRGGYAADVPESHRIEFNEPHGPGRFEVQSLPDDPQGRGVWIDVDRDGREELLVAGPKGTTLYRRGSGGWMDASEEVGLEGIPATWDVSTIDSDGDGWRGVYLARKGYMGQGENILLRNEEGRFREVTDEVGLSGERATARVLCIDLTGDGKTDILEVGNDGPTPAVRLYVRDDDRFHERASDLGLVYPGNAVDAAVADFDGNGRKDVFILGWKRPGRLFLNTEEGFADRTRESGLVGIGGDGLSVVALDFDRDGWQDLLVTAHAPVELSLRRMLHMSISDRLTPRLLRNNRGRFEDVTAELDLNRNYGTMQAISADFDGDGWPDLVFAHGGLERQHIEPSLVLRNDKGRRFVEWAYLPSRDRPLNARGVAASAKGVLFLSGLGIVRYEAS